MTGTETQAAPLPEQNDGTRELRPNQSSDAVTVHIPGYGDVVQRPLTYFTQIEFFALVAKGIDRAMQRGLNVDQIIASLDIDAETEEKMRAGEVDMGQVGSMNALLGLAVKLGADLPDLMRDAYLIALAIPAQDRRLVRGLLDGLDAETGELVLDTFLAQNGQAVSRFLPRWWEKISAMRTQMKGQSDT